MIAGTFDAQRAAFRLKIRSYGERISALQALEQALLDHRDGLVRAISDDFNGRAEEETLTLELVPTLGEIREARRHLKGWMKRRAVAVDWQFRPARARIEMQPKGVIGILGAWNYPLFLTIGPAIGAVAAGNHLMIKPSELAPRTGALLGEMIAKTFPPDYVAVVNGGAEVAQEFSSLPFDHLLFTGSTRVGKLVMRAAAENLTPVTLELGGKSPALVHPDYPLRTAAERILTGKLYNAGQTCVAPDYLLLPRALNDEFLRIAPGIISGMYPKLVANPDYTRIIDAAHYRTLVALVDDAREKGAQTIQPSEETYNEENRVFPPTLLLHVTDEMAVMQQEIFGPILPIVLYDTLDKAISYINARPHPLALYYFDLNRSRVKDVLARTTAGGVTVNDCMFHVGQSGLPFGGIGPSGMGHYHGVHGFETFSNQKGIFLESRWTPLRLMRPPYSKLTRRILGFLMRG
ncbi:MAG: coniferyl aldehyde dehydrogenase [Bryobacteraceae bacterium]